MRSLRLREFGFERYFKSFPFTSLHSRSKKNVFIRTHRRFRKRRSRRIALRFDIGIWMLINVLGCAVAFPSRVSSASLPMIFIKHCTTCRNHACIILITNGIARLVSADVSSQQRAKQTCVKVFPLEVSKEFFVARQIMIFTTLLKLRKFSHSVN